jgi:hypothetical protein
MNNSVQTTTPWTFCPECGCEEYREGIDGERECVKCTQSWFPDVNYMEAVAQNLRRVWRSE